MNIDRTHSPISEKEGYQHTPIYSINSGLQNQYGPCLIFETLHPDDMKNYFVFSSLNTNKEILSATYPYEEVSSLLSGRALHRHDYFELIYVIRGEIIQRIETEQHLYPEGSLCLLNRNVRHQELFNTDFRAVFLELPVQFVKTLLMDMDDYFFDIEQQLHGAALIRFFKNNISHLTSTDKEYMDFIPLKDNGADPRYMYRLFETLTKQFLAPTIGSSYFIKSALIQIFYELSFSGHYDNRPLNIGSDAESELFNSISARIQKRHGNITRKELEIEMSYTGDYMNRIVKKYTGLSLQQYALELCMQNAAQMLRETSKTTSEICDELHFTNKTYFYKHFKRIYGLTPKQYRIKYASQTPLL